MALSQRRCRAETRTREQAVQLERSLNPWTCCPTTTICSSSASGIRRISRRRPHQRHVNTRLALPCGLLVALVISWLAGNQLSSSCLRFFSDACLCFVLSRKKKFKTICFRPHSFLVANLLVLIRYINSFLSLKNEIFVVHLYFISIFNPTAC